MNFIKCFGCIRCMEAFNPASVVRSAPSGGGIIVLLSIIIPIFTMLPRMAPASTAKMFLIIGFIVVVLIIQLRIKYFEISNPFRRSNWNKLNPKLLFFVKNLFRIQNLFCVKSKTAMNIVRNWL